MAENFLQQQQQRRQRETRPLFKDDMTSDADFARRPHASSIQATFRHSHCGHIQQISGLLLVWFFFLPHSPDDASKLLIPCIKRMYV